MISKKKRSKYVDFENNLADFEAILLGSLGKSTQFIMMQTGLSPGQISYRLKKQQIRRMDYRNGISELSQRLLTVERKVAWNYLRKNI